MVFETTASERGLEKKESKTGLDYERHFTKGIGDRSVYEMFEWTPSDIEIKDDDMRKTVFTQKGAQFPKEWEYQPRQIVASKYFYGEQNTSERENSAKDLIGRVSDTFKEWAIKQAYFNTEEEANKFKDELAYLALSQRMAFNSPVWFNTGVHLRLKNKNQHQKNAYIVGTDGEPGPLPIGTEYKFPQTSACFIQSVDDTMESIMQLATNEAMLFKYGSGTGTNLSTLRSSREKLSGGGKPSGPLAYWAFYDKVASVVKSGGKTRRAAKMDILNVSHPDIMEFIKSKQREEEKARILMANGIPSEEAASTVSYQNTNISVRVPDEFMETLEKDGIWKTAPIHNEEIADQMPAYKARDIMKAIVEANLKSGDPGMQFDTTVNKWNTVPNTARINATNPCGEYNFVDNSSCNLASINLLKYRKPDGTFDIEGFKSSVRTTAIAQDLEFDNSSYPTAEIAKNSHRLRPLGQGYANLGALFMSLGLPYDSEEAKAVAAAITALQTGTVYETSADLASRVGTFEEFEKNREPMLNVMNMHRAALSNIDKSRIPKGLENILEEAEKTWDRVIEKGEKFGYRNGQATVIAPTGTIGYMMGCDTLGIEPEFGLVKVKKLAGGGTLKIINTTIEPTLKNLGYNAAEIKSILNYVIEKATMEGAPHIKNEHLAIFDCAGKPEGAKRYISVDGHLKMMAATQPFISGAISKTVNLPSTATPQEVEDTFVKGWKMGLKAIALYVDGTKGLQPLSFQQNRKAEDIGKVRPVRKKLPNERLSITHKFAVVEHEGYITAGLYEDGTLGEIFINMSKQGSTIGGLMDAFATSISIGLQHGVPLELLVKKFTNQKFEPYGIVYEGHPEIKTATSIIDYIFNWLGKKFTKGNGNSKTESIEAAAPEAETTRQSVSTKPETFCPHCGEAMTEKGNCNKVCLKCNHLDPTGCGG